MSKPYHISAHDLNRYHFDAIRGPELAMIEEHLLWCHDCLDRAEADLRLRRDGQVYAEHISTDGLERYHLGQLEKGILMEVTEHLAECLDCSHRLLAVERFIQLVRAGAVRGEFYKDFKD
jgi:hypothetical protein